jgi:DNA-directed RNA polymerase subunit M/transcription elongation factor TFIIS
MISEILSESTILNKKEVSELTRIIKKFDSPNELLYEAIGMLNSGLTFDNVKEDFSNNNFGWKSIAFKKMRDSRALRDKIIATPPEVREGEMPCPKCQQKKTLVVEMQTRSADEGFTYFIHCFNPKCKAVTK